MTRPQAEAFLKAHDYIPGTSDTSALAVCAARVGTHRELPGDADARQLRLDIKKACRVIFEAPPPPPPQRKAKVPTRKKKGAS